MDDLDLERLVDRELKRLPATRAPRTLLPRVMAAVADARPVAWYSRPWLEWHWALQALSVVVFGALASGGWMLWNQAPDVALRLNQTAAVSRALWSVFLGPIAFVVLALAVVVALAGAAAWTAVSRVTFGGVSSQ